MKLHEILKENLERNLLNRKKAERWGDTYHGYFQCSQEELTSLNGAPNEVQGDFYCSGNHLTSLVGAPSLVTGDFYCHDNDLTSLEGAPKEVGMDFYCRNNQLTSVDNCPTRVGGSFNCNKNPIVSFAGIGSHFKDGYIKGKMFIPGTLKSHMLGILLIPKLRGILISDDIQKVSKVTNILNRHLARDRDILECQEELRTAGLREYGKL